MLHITENMNETFSVAKYKFKRSFTNFSDGFPNALADVIPGKISGVNPSGKYLGNHLEKHLEIYLRIKNEFTRIFIVIQQIYIDLILSD